MSSCLLCLDARNHPFGWQEFLGFGIEKEICASCEESFERIMGEVCGKCGRVWADVTAEHRHGSWCADCQKWEGVPDYEDLLLKNRSAFRYNDFMKEVLAQYKFRGDAILVSIFKKDFQQVYNQYFKKDELILVPIPLSKERLWERGFNQSCLLAQLLEKEFVEPLAKKESEKQSKKAREDRLTVENTFYVPNPDLVEGKKILLIDDIYTTGMTIRLAARKLKEAGAREISSLTLVRS